MRNLLLLTILSTLLAAPLGWSQEQEEAATAPAAAPAMPPGEVVYPSSVGEVHFPHNRHLSMGCQQCHHQIKAGPLKTPHPDYLDSSWINCETCHSENAASGGTYYKCGLCHHSAPDNIADETLSAKVVTHKMCWKCHQSGEGTDASRGCGDCHQDTEVK